MDVVQADIQQFLDANIKSFDQLEILRILAESPEREWTPSDLATQVQSPKETIAKDLAELGARGLLTTTTLDNVVTARHGPATSHVEGQLRAVLQLYQERPVTLIRLVYAQANQRLRSFADAFKLRKEG